MQPTWLLTVASAGSVRVKMVESEGGDYPNHPCTSLSLARCASHSPTPCMFPSMGWHATGYLVHHIAHPALYPCSPSPDHHSQGLRSRPNSSPDSQHASVSGSSSLSESGLDEESGTGSPGSGSGSPEQSRSASPDVVFLGENEEGPIDAEGEDNELR